MMSEDLAAGNDDTPFSLADIDYHLPDGMIAQQPLPRRDASRLLVLNRVSGSPVDGRITDLPGLLRPGDLLVLNDTKVVPAKFVARRATGGKVVGLFVREPASGEWEVMLEGSRRLRVGEQLSVSWKGNAGAVTLTLSEFQGRGFWRVTVDAEGPAWEILDRIGVTPLPRYIRRDEPGTAGDMDDRSRYQTVYARRPGAIAAPTAGLHLTDALLEELRGRHVETAFVTLHVGVGTFKPIEVDDVSRHTMHAEWFELPPEAVEAVGACRKRGGRVVAVGTTSVRVLESSVGEPREARSVRPASGMTDVYIYPPYRFGVVDAILTNFHLPKSTLLALVMAFAGIENIRRAYRHAIERKYRFYSYGDAMLIE